MKLETQDQVLDKAVSISPCTNTLRKDMNSSFLPPAIDK